jgi:hypothetical protein
MHADKAELQRGAIYSVSASPLTKGLLWAGTDDGLIWVTQNEGGAWSSVTPPDLKPWSKVTQIEASHFDANVAYASVSRFRLDDLKPYVYRTRDGGKSWQSITNGLSENAPVNSVREDPMRRGLLFAATEKAVWVSLDDGEHWQSLQLNLPHTSMRDLAVHNQDLIVATHGRSFWVLDDIGPLREFTGAAPHREAMLLKPSPAVRARRSTGTDTPIPPDEPAGRNPPDGAVIDYYLPQDVKGALSIEVLDAGGTVMRRMSSTDPVGFSAAEREKELIPVYWIRQPKALATTAGMHRFVWDLHGTAPRAMKRSFPISAVAWDTPQEPLGPLAIPGVYQVRLKIGARKWEQPLTVMSDPRITLGQQDYAAQFALAKRLADSLDASTAKAQEIKSLRAQLKALSAAQRAAVAPQAKELDEHFESLMEKGANAQAGGAQAGSAQEAKAQAGSAPRGLERVNGDLLSLYTQALEADAAPTAAQQSAADGLFKEWQSLFAAAAKIWQDDLVPLNQALKHARLPTLRSDAVAPEEGESNDEE